MVRDVSMSGVLFTQDLNTGAPYFVINYDDESGRTDTVAAGTGYGNRTLFVHRDSWRELRSSRFSNLLEAVEEIEREVGSDSLDIEFALDSCHRVHILQVRRITTQPNWNRRVTLQVNDALGRLREAVCARFGPLPGIRGSRSILGKMPDWNPAEMIGSTPRPLALSLYRHLITDRAWRVARRRMGYSEPSGMPLMVSLAGQPFIDVRLSFHSFLPADLPVEIGDKLADAWLDRLEANLHLHDRVEFEVAITGLALDFDERMRTELPAVLSADEQSRFKDSLRRLTNALLSGRTASIADQLADIEKLAQRRRALLRSHAEPDMSLVSALLEDCIELGTIPFSILARHAFLAAGLLQSLQEAGVLSAADVENFQRSVPTVASELIADVDRVSLGDMSHAAFMERYGHLRPGTYDIQSIRYDRRDDVLAARPGAQVRQPEPPAFVLSAGQNRAVEKLLAEHGLEIDADGLLDYVRAATQGREYAKFVFTRNISDAIEIIAAWGESIGLSRDELSFLDVRAILDCLVVAKGRTLEDHFRDLSTAGRQEYEVTTAIHLPYLISRPSDLVVVPLLLGSPNFITSKHCQGACVLIAGDTLDPTVIDQKIVAIESADPGFDWIFSRPILGLVTKFGGANSHMAIRCAEFGLPAAIGCGERKFDELESAPLVELNCAARTVRAVRG